MTLPNNNTPEQKAVKKLVIGLAETYGVNLNEARLQIYCDILLPYGPGSVDAAVSSLIRDPRVRAFPLPAQILERIGGTTLDPDLEAVEASNRILQAIEKYGWARPIEAKMFIGSLGWLVVEREGGWEKVCENTMVDNMPQFKAQWRELAKALQARARAGVVERGPELPRPGEAESKSRLQQLASSVGKKL